MPTIRQLITVALTAFDGLSNAAAWARRLSVKAWSVVINVDDVNVTVKARSVPIVNLRLVQLSIGRDDVELVVESVVDVQRADRVDASALARRYVTL